MHSLNKFQAIGNLGKGGVSIRFTPTGKKVGAGSIAMNNQYVNAQGVKTENTEWLNFEVWEKAAEIMAEFTAQGSKVYIEGRIKTDKVVGTDGAPDKYFTKCVIQEFMFLDGKKAGTTVAGAPILPGDTAPAEDIAF